MSKFLYGAAVQGIQSFIFQTNELRDIVGASELVEKICTDEFKKFAKNGKSVLGAAGNIKYIFDNKEDCQKAVHDFPKIVADFAPGILFSQAVVKIEDNFSKAVDELEQKLREQRNKSYRSQAVGLMGMLRSRETGFPVVCCEKGEYLDEATRKKRKDRENATVTLCEKAFGYKEGTLKNSKKVAFNVSEITGQNDWIAIIHADGNGLGQVVQKIGKDENKLIEFSNKLDAATINSAVSAFKNKVVPYLKDDKTIIPVRPIVLGGDDFTVICRADLALDYVTAYLEEFERQTENLLGPILNKSEVFTNAKKLTACAGIAFIKSSYPFYYGYNLAETLCSEAKKDAKSIENITNNGGIAPSCLMFHKVQDSFVENFDKITKRELTPTENCSFKFGPYYLDNDASKNKWSIDQLISNQQLLNKENGNAVKSHLRQWMTILHDNGEDAAKQKAERIMSLIPEEQNELKSFIQDITNLETEKKTSPVYDILAINTIMNQKTK